MSLKKLLDAFDLPMCGELNGPLSLREGLHLALGTNMALSALKEYINLIS